MDNNKERGIAKKMENKEVQKKSKEQSERNKYV